MRRRTRVDAVFVKTLSKPDEERYGTPGETVEHLAVVGHGPRSGRIARDEREEPAAVRIRSAEGLLERLRGRCGVFACAVPRRRAGVASMALCFGGRAASRRRCAGAASWKARSRRAARGAAAARRGRAARRGVGVVKKPRKVPRSRRTPGRTSRGGIGNGFGGSGGLLVRHGDWCCCFLSLGLRARANACRLRELLLPLVHRPRRGDGEGCLRLRFLPAFPRAQRFVLSDAG